MQGSGDPASTEARNGGDSPPVLGAERLAEAEKLASLAHLAGTVAHEFNNLLTAIIGYSELVADQLAETSPEVADDVGEIRRAARRAQDLTQRLLVIAGRQVLHPEMVDPNELVEEAARRLAKTLGEAVELKLALTPDLEPIEVDPAQVERALLELAANACDAMPSGGALTMKTATVVLTEELAAACPNARPGSHAVFSVTDCGEGIPAEDLPRLFEPFFTTRKGINTKERGRHEGLGLALVRGIVSQHGGHVRVESAPNLGTTIALYFPRDAPHP